MFGKGLWIISSGREEVPDSYDANTENGYTSTPTTYTISSVADADAFCERFQRKYGYKDSEATLHIGDKVQINDGTYNVDWYVAGFDVEYNKTASDGTVYNNGYGIALVPVTQLDTPILIALRGYANTYYYYSQQTSLSGFAAYSSDSIYAYSKLHYTPVLKSVLGNHLVPRTVLVSNAVSSLNASRYNRTRYECTSSYTWVNDFCVTLLSLYQILGTNQTLNPLGFGSISGSKASSQYNIITQYDIGEANYKLPLFDNISCYDNINYAIRGFRLRDYDDRYEEDDVLYGYIALLNSASSYTWKQRPSSQSRSESIGPFRPMIYIR